MLPTVGLGIEKSRTVADRITEQFAGLLSNGLAFASKKSQGSAMCSMGLHVRFVASGLRLGFRPRLYGENHFGFCIWVQAAGSHTTCAAILICENITDIALNYYPTQDAGMKVPTYP